MKLNRMMTNICSDQLPASKLFYTTLFDFRVDYDNDWFVHLISADQQLELGIIDRTHAIVPPTVQQAPTGFYVTFVVEDVDAVFEVAKTNSFEVISEPEDAFYGQRRLLLKDPDGAIVDVSAPIPNFQF